MNVPFFRVELSSREIRAVTSVLRSGWLTTGPAVKQFEHSFATAVGGRHAVAVNSATAALHLALHALGVRARQAVLVPTVTFASTAEVVRYFDAVPILVDCDRETLNMSLEDAEQKLKNASREYEVVGVMPVYVGGLMMRTDEMRRFANRHGLWIVEDAAHAFPAAWRSNSSKEWIHCGSGTADVTCFSFYANKTITTGEGGMAVTPRRALADRIRLMSLHGLSSDAWTRYSGGRKWDYRIVAPGYKYNLTDVAASLGMEQLARAERLRVRREEIAQEYFRRLSSIQEIQLPPNPPNRIHAWHLFPIRTNAERLRIDRDQLIQRLQERGVGCSVHWRPLHLHPYYRRAFGTRASDCPVAAAEWRRLVSLPLFPAMRDAEIGYVVESVAAVCEAHRKRVRRCA